MNKERLYEQDLKKLSYTDRISSQEEIQSFIQQVFTVCGQKSELSFDDFFAFNKKTSSEMFLSLISVLHHKLPCSANCFRMKKIYKTREKGFNIRKSNSQIREIA